MRTGIVFFRLQCKKYSKILPVILAESFLCAVLIVMLGLVVLKLSGQSSSISEIKVAVVLEEDEDLTKLLVRFVGGMESFEETVTFLQMEKDEAYEVLERGEIYAAVILPEGVLESILNGTNIPVRVVLSRAGSEMETAIFEEVVKAGGRMLSVAQEGIYAAEDFCLETGHYDKISEADDYLNAVYLKYSLNRNAIFKQEKINATGDVGLLTYYGAALLLVFFTFAGVVLGKHVQVYPSELSSVLAASGFKRIWQYFCDVLAFSGVFALAGGVIGCPVLLVCIRQADMGSTGVLLCIIFVLVLFAIGVFIRMLFQITGNESGGTGCIFVLLFAMMFACGLFLPSAFLPLWADKLGQMLPYKFWLELLLQSMWDEVESYRVGNLLTGCVCSLFIGAVLFCLNGSRSGRRLTENGR